MTPTMRAAVHCSIAGQLPIRRALALAVALLIIAPAGASATVFSGTATDRVDGASPPSRNIVAAKVSYDDAGRVTAVISFAGDPAVGQNTFVGVLVRPCAGTGYGGVGTFTQASTTAWLRDDNGDGTSEATGPATRTFSGNTVTLDSPTTPALAGQAWRCATVSSRDPGGAAVDSIARFTLAPPPAPVPGPPPSTAPEPNPAPPPTAGAAKSKLPAHKIDLVVKGLPSTLRRDHTTRVKVNVRNGGRQTATRLRVRLQGARGLSLSKSQRITKLAPGTSRTLTFRIKLTKRARNSTPLVIRAAGDKVTAKRTVTLHLRAKASGS